MIELKKLIKNTIEGGFDVSYNSEGESYEYFNKDFVVSAVIEVIEDINHRHEEAMKEMAKEAWDKSIEWYKSDELESEFEGFEKWYNEQNQKR